MVFSFLLRESLGALSFFHHYNGEREWRASDNFMEVDMAYVKKKKKLHQGSLKINVLLSFCGDEHLIFYRFSQMVFCQWSVSVPLAPTNVFTVDRLISFGDKWYQLKKTNNFVTHLRVWWIDASVHFHFSGQTKSAHHFSSCCLSPDTYV